MAELVSNDLKLGEICRLLEERKGAEAWKDLAPVLLDCSEPEGVSSFRLLLEKWVNDRLGTVKELAEKFCEIGWQDVTSHLFEHFETMKTDVTRLLPLLAERLYGSDWNIVIRELLQNAHDAILERRDLDAKWSAAGRGRIDIWYDLDEGSLTVVDDGMGMTQEGVSRKLATIAFSSKGERSSRAGTISVIGQFGIGFLSSFIVADKIEVSTRAEGSAAVKATFACATVWKWEFCDRESTGTSVKLTLKPNVMPRNFKAVQDSVRLFSDLLPVPAVFHEGTTDVIGKICNTMTPPWDDECSSPEEIVKFVASRREMPDSICNADCLLPSAVHVANEDVKFDAVVYFVPLPQVKDRIELFANRMYVGKLKGLSGHLKFFSAVIDCPSLTLTLDRNAVAEDTGREKLIDALKIEVANVLKSMHKERPAEFRRMLRAVRPKFLRCMEDEYLFQELIEIIPFRVLHYNLSYNLMTIPAYIKALDRTKYPWLPSARGDIVYYLKDPDPQVRALAIEHEVPVICTGSGGEERMLRRYTKKRHDVKIQEASDILSRTSQAVEQAPYLQLKEVIMSHVTKPAADVMVCKFEPASIAMVAERHRGPSWSEDHEDAPAELRLVIALFERHQQQENVLVRVNAKNKPIRRIAELYRKATFPKDVLDCAVLQLYHSALVALDKDFLGTEDYRSHEMLLLTKYLDAVSTLHK